jgi:phosphatidylglycerophosphatase B
MYEIAKRTAGGALLLLLMPLVVWASGWHWQPGGNDRLLKALYWVTETVTSPWGILTSAILCGWFLWCLRFRLKAAIGLAILLFAALLIGQGV